MSQLEFFYNTIDLPAPELEVRQETARSQEEEILEVFELRPYECLTPFEVQDLTGIECINSVRRSMTNLSKRGKLVKTDVKKVGKYGTPNYTWKLK